MTDYIPRLADAQLSRLLRGWPAVFITGPRAVGKTTSAHRRAKSAIHLERPEDRRLAEDDPTLAIAETPYPLLIDEWQYVPEILGAVKRLVDHNRRPPGRFIITGSAGHHLHHGQWPGTGRFLDLRLWPITGRERFGDARLPSLFDRWDGERRFLVPPGRGVARLNIADYLKIALTGGFPDAIAAFEDTELRSHWMRAYVDATVTKDVGELSNGVGRRRSALGLRRYLAACALNTAGTATTATLASAAALNHRTARSYHDLLDVLRLVADAPAWHSNRLERLTSMPKLYLSDTGLAAWLMGVESETLKQDVDARGRLLDTYVAAQIRAEAEVYGGRAQMFHLRTKGGQREIDLIVEFGRRVAAFEVKSGSAPNRNHARHLAWLRDRLPPERFAGGVVFHTGPNRYGLGKGIEAVPICGLWGPPG